MSETKCFVVYKGVDIDETKTPPLRRHIEVVPFEDGLHYLQSLVDGHIEHYIIDKRLNAYHIDMWINEEGKFRDDFKPTFALLRDGKLVDAIVGPCVFSKYNDEGETLGLSLNEMNIVIDWIQNHEVVGLVSTDDTIHHCIAITL